MTPQKFLNLIEDELYRDLDFAEWHSKNDLFKR